MLNRMIARIIANKAEHNIGFELDLTVVPETSFAQTPSY